MLKLMCKKIIKIYANKISLSGSMHIISLLSNSWNKDLWHVRIQKILSEGSNTDNVFFLVDGMERGSKSH